MNELLAAAVVVLQVTALAVVVARLARGRRRRSPLLPLPGGAPRNSVSVILPTLNERDRIAPCLAGLHAQGDELGEVIVVDSRSTDGTRELVAGFARGDSRLRLVTDDPLPDGWIGKVWALQAGLGQARFPWVLGVDADTEAEPGMVGAVVVAATEYGYDAVSFAPRFAAQSAAERWLQPALLVTLVYRFGPPGDPSPDPDRVMANGQCFLARREMLESCGGYSVARDSFSDDVTLARHLARSGHRVGFLDGSRIVTTRAYRSAWETWREWGRSIDLKDSTSKARQWADVLFLILVQGLPLALLALLSVSSAFAASPLRVWLFSVNGALLCVRVLILVALRDSYERRGMPFWLSPAADPLAALRIVLSTVRRPRAWRGRAY